MRRWSALALALLAFYFGAAPLLACVVPQQALTAQERECCRHMQQMCGSASMPQSHSCCTVKTGTPNTATITRTHSAGPAAATLVMPLASDGLRPAMPAHGFTPHRPPTDSLPGSTVLRI
ncbi:MAG TPA: hypothetical protein VFU27_11245 [Terriglobales bacterium]|nr:hypothetical protein [Terriglobales bacterium]